MTSLEVFKLGCMLRTPGEIDLHVQIPASSPRDLDLGCGRGIGNVKSSPCDFNVQPNLTTTVPELQILRFWFEDSKKKKESSGLHTNHLEIF